MNYVLPPIKFVVAITSQLKKWLIPFSRKLPVVATRDISSQQKLLGHKHLNCISN